ncbi:Aste57867_18434 [Aphanomyces stellatus]|uniref:Aste57867_18434 protein n=1 Tax=Aphanomyces stellatus TaxID=120398 RepID=A0A485LAY5_9STRA|nr:hypothetical protein As57867_018372 [Aphanomyces stellatus]VFT95170.1 Aste57867_18434 [Aphanomyces stellatus]
MNVELPASLVSKTFKQQAKERYTARGGLVLDWNTLHLRGSRPLHAFDSVMVHVASCLGAVVAAIAASCLWSLFFSTPDDTPPHASLAFDSFFADDYYHARALFRASAAAANATQHVIPYIVPNMDLSIDIAILPGSFADDVNASVVVHLSGIHGVEGFAGSAIQSAWLASQSATSASKPRPTIVLVHAANPYGFAKLRRVNEHNVDLNRNHLTTVQFQAKQAESPNLHGYANMHAFLNPTPTTMGSWFDSLYPRAFYHYLVSGYTQCLRTIVSGTYHFDTGLYYGGHRLEPSHRLLHDFFQANLNLKAIHRVAFLDVHTGLGPRGHDTLDIYMPPSVVNRAAVFDRFNWSATPDAMWTSYDRAVGAGIEGYLNLFPQAPVAVGVTQEFGTVSPLAVLTALRTENAATQHDPTRRWRAAQALRDVFYLHEDWAWKWQVASRGMALLDHVVATMA